MRARLFCVPAAGILAAALLSFPVAHAQLGDLLKHEGGSSGGLGNLGGMLSGQSTTSGSLGNVAGLLEFCVKNNYLSGNGVSSVKDSLMSKLSGKPSSDSGYADGAKGILSGSNGKQLDLSGGGLKQRVTKQICDKVLAQGKSML
ncbi:MAG: DUF2501 domain-containing protein [Terriglobia bacterium]